MKLATLSIPFLALALCHCAGLAMPAAPTAPGLTSGVPGAPAAPGTETAKPEMAKTDGAKPEAQKPEAQKPMIPTTVEIHSDCSKTVSVFYGEKPKFGSGKKSSVSSNSTFSEGRGSDGTLMVWIIDDHENGVASVKVTPETKRVTIGASCKDITAK